MWLNGKGTGFDERGSMVRELDLIVCRSMVRALNLILRGSMVKALDLMVCCLVFRAMDLLSLAQWFRLQSKTPVLHHSFNRCALIKLNQT